MNGTCAGGTGAFIDQMAVTAKYRRKLALTKQLSITTLIYPIAARCGVFAKTDIQPLINEGAATRGSGRFDISGRSQPDYKRTCMRPHYKRKRCVPRRTAFIYVGAQKTLYRDARSLSDENVIFPENSQVLRSDRRCIQCQHKHPVVSIRSLSETNKAAGHEREESETKHLDRRCLQTEADYESFQKETRCSIG